MPLSNPDHISTVLSLVRSVSPTRILDVGVGTGAYGMLIRQALDIGYERVSPESWRVRIDGVEIFSGYRNPIWDYAYDNVHIGDIQDIAGSLGNFDLILCGDVLEHLTKPDALRLVSRCLGQTDVLIATTPNRQIQQGAWGGNPAETHRCLLAPDEFPGLVGSIRTGITDCIVCTRHVHRVFPLLVAIASAPRARIRRPFSYWNRFLRRVRQLPCVRRVQRVSRS